MKYKNYARFKRKKIKQKQELNYVDSEILFGLSLSKTFSGIKKYIRREIAFCDQIKTPWREEKKADFQKELQELEVYSVNEF